MFSVMFALETAARKPAIIRSSNSRSPLHVRIVGIRYPDTSLSRSDGYEHLTTAKFTISSVNGKIWLCTKMAERRGCDVTCNRSIGCHTPAQRPSSLSGQKPALCKVRVVFSKPVHAVRAWGGPPGTNHGLFKAKSALLVAIHPLRDQAAFLARNQPSAR